MCGRFAVVEPIDWSVFQVSSPQQPLALNADIRPSETIACVVQQDGQRQISHLPWGFQPSWSRRLLINARAETAATKSTFAEAFRARRCLIPCHGWYEWAPDGEGQRQRHWFRAYDHRQLAMAGLWYPESEQSPRGAVVSLTVAPNADCAAYHDRMPLLIPKVGYGDWLDPACQDERLGALLCAPPLRLIKAQVGLAPMASA